MVHVSFCILPTRLSLSNLVSHLEDVRYENLLFTFREEFVLWVSFLDYILLDNVQFNFNLVDGIRQIRKRLRGDRRHINGAVVGIARIEDADGPRDGLRGGAGWQLRPGAVRLERLL